MQLLTPEKIELLFRRLTIGVLIFLATLGAVMVFYPIKPFWIDEWFIIYSLKTKSTREIFGQLAFLQQFPRVYLACWKVFTQAFNYSYWSLRLPSYLVSLGTMALTWRVMRQLFPVRAISRYLLVLLLVSSFTFTEYFTETKQYIMDIFLCVLAVWQLLKLLAVVQGDPANRGGYLLLCATCLVAPFFSYTYAIATAPAYPVVLLAAFYQFKKGQTSTLARTLLPLLLNALGITLFYLLDAGRLVSDPIMYSRWDFLLVDHRNALWSFLTSAYTLFAQLGSGFVFEQLLGILGVSAFLLGLWQAVRDIIRRAHTTDALLRLYSCGVLGLTFILFLAGKLPLGTPRLNAFTTPSIAILLIYLLAAVAVRAKHRWQQTLLPIILCLGLSGNVFTTYINYFTSDWYKGQSAIYKATEAAITTAQTNHVPLLISLDIAYPYQQAVIDAGDPAPGAWVLKTFPAYDMRHALPVYYVRDTAQFSSLIDTLPQHINAVMAGDGQHYRVLKRTAR